MTYNYAGTKFDIAAVITRMGFQVTLSKTDGTVAKTFGIWGKNEKVTVDSGISQVYGEKKTLYLSATGKRAPEVGDTIILDGANWSVDNVEQYKPAKVAVAYKLLVSN
jgi:hypothetical protein